MKEKLSKQTVLGIFKKSKVYSNQAYAEWKKAPLKTSRNTLWQLYLPLPGLVSVWKIAAHVSGLSNWSLFSDGMMQTLFTKIHVLSIVYLF